MRNLMRLIVMDIRGIIMKEIAVYFAILILGIVTYNIAKDILNFSWLASAGAEVFVVFCAIGTYEELKERIG